MRALALAAVLVAFTACGGTARARPVPPPLTDADAPDEPGRHRGGDAGRPTAAQLLDASDARSGGEAALAAVRTMRLRGSLRVEPMDARGTFELVYGDGEQFSHVMAVPGVLTRTLASDGRRVWEVTSTAGARLLDEEEAIEVRRERPSKVAPWRTRYREVALEGPSELDGRPVWMIRVTDRNGDRELLYVDRDSYFVLGIDSVHHGPAGEVDIRTRFATFLQAGDLTLPGTMVVHDARGLTITITTEQIELDPALPAGLFTPPRALRAQLKRR